MSTPLNSLMIREAAFLILHGNMHSMAKLYASVKDATPEEKAVGKAMCAYLVKHKKKMHKEAVK